MTLVDYRAMYAARGGLCDICKSPADDSMPVDHDHATGAVRGLLCQNCNKGLGHYRDDPRLLRAAADYVERACIWQGGTEPTEEVDH